LITKNKDQASTTGGPNAFNIFNWVIDANPQDIQVMDFKRPNGEVVMRTIADYRQLNDATFHAGLNSGSQYEWLDVHNRLHFYIVDVHRAPNGVQSYTLGVRSLDGAGSHTRGVALTAPSGPLTQDGRALFTLRNTGTRAASPASVHPRDASAYTGTDVYRLSVSVEGQGWAAQLQNVLAAVPFGESQQIPVTVLFNPGETTAPAQATAQTAIVTLRAVSESDPTKTTTVAYTVSR
jgi:hypothetical protein